jgi:hypothetical protein
MVTKFLSIPQVIVTGPAFGLCFKREGKLPVSSSDVLRRCNHPAILKASEGGEPCQRLFLSQCAGNLIFRARRRPGMAPVRWRDISAGRVMVLVAGESAG